MSEIAVCRACLATNVMLYPTVNLYTQEVYQHLTNLSFESPEGKPQCLCYECHASMRRCADFRDKCLRADGVLSQLACSQMLTAEAVSMVDRHIYNLTSKLICTPMEIITTEPCYSSPIKTESDLDVKVDLLHDIDKIDMTWPQNKQEYEEIDIELAAHNAVKKKQTVGIENLKMEPQSEESIFEVKVKASDDFEGMNHSDSEDDLPLTRISKSQEKTGKKRKRKGEKSCGKTAAFEAPYAKEVTLTMDEQMAEMRARASSTNYLHSQFKCELCFKGFVDETAFRNHLDKHNESRGPLSCCVCALRYATERQLRAHTVSAHARQYHCLACRHRSHTAHQAREHERWHRGLTYSCRLCGAKFRKPTSHLTHMRKKHATEHVCVRCGESFVGRRGLVVHDTKTHREKGPARWWLECPFCLGTSPQPCETPGNEHCCSISCYWEPVYVEGTPEVERTCQECSIVFMTVEACNRHLVNSVKHKDDTENSNACSKCSERFASPDELLAHQRVHRAERRAPSGVRLTCNYCSSTFANRSKLQAHIKRVHLGLKYNRNVVCELCGKRCTSNATLRYHQRTHTGERPYACAAPACARRFADSNQLRIHARTHSGERPYACELCSKAFRQKPALNRHMRVHTGAKPYGCQYCAKTFSQSNSLKLHIRTVHFKLPSNSRRSKGQNPPAAEKEMQLS